jgi:hypothetical protein
MPKDDNSAGRNLNLSEICRIFEILNALESSQWPLVVSPTPCSVSVFATTSQVKSLQIKSSLSLKQQTTEWNPNGCALAASSGARDWT